MSKELEIYEERPSKAQRWRELGASPSGNGHRREHLGGAILRTHEKDAPGTLEQSEYDRPFHLQPRPGRRRQCGEPSFRPG